jgi:hypothetical protein
MMMMMMMMMMTMMTAAASGAGTRASHARQPRLLTIKWSRA